MRTSKNVNQELTENGLEKVLEDWHREAIQKGLKKNEVSYNPFEDDFNSLNEDIFKHTSQKYNCIVFCQAISNHYDDDYSENFSNPSKLTQDQDISNKLPPGLMVPAFDSESWSQSDSYGFNRVIPFTNSKFEDKVIYEKDIKENLQVEKKQDDSNHPYNALPSKAEILRRQEEKQRVLKEEELKKKKEAEKI